MRLIQRKMKRIKVITMVLAALLINTAIVFSQNQKNNFRSFKGNERGAHISKLSDDQKAALKEVHEKYAESLKELRLEIAEAQAHQKTLMGKANPDETAILKNVGSVSKMKGEMSKKMLAMKLETQKLINPEGKMMRSGFGQHQGRKGMRGQGHNRSMNQGKSSPESRFAQKNRRGGHGDGQFAQGNKSQRMSKEKMQGKRNHANGIQKKSGSMKGQAEGRMRSENRRGNQKEKFLTEDQIASMKEIKIKNHQRVVDLRNELNELNVHQKTILSQKEVNLKDAYKNLDKITSLKTELAKMHAQSQLEFRSLLSEEQKAKMGHMKKRMHNKRG